MLNRGFFSLQAPWIPTVSRSANLVLNTALYAVFYRVGVWGIPLAISLANIAGVGAALRPLRRRVGRLELHGIASARSCSSRSPSRRARRRRLRRLARARRGARPLVRGQLVSLGAALASAASSTSRVCTRAPGTRDGGATIAARPLPPGLITHGPSTHPQLLDHRAHRPWQVDARRPHPAAHRHGRRARHAGAAARLDGPRARARDHDQGAGRARPLEGPPAQPDRHARARRLHVRGLALAAGLRGRAARRRRGAGDRGADARERVPRDRERPRDRPGREQDRPAAGRPGRRRRRGRRPDRRRPRRRPAHLGQDRPRRRGRARRDRRADPAAERRPRRPRRAR